MKQAELETATPGAEIGGFALYLATFYAWNENGLPRLVTAAADINSAWWTVRTADLTDGVTVDQPRGSQVIRLINEEDGAVTTTVVPVADGLLDHHVPTLEEARTIPLARRWRTSELLTDRTIREPEAAERYELRDLLVRAARRGETVATSPGLIIVRNTDHRPVAFIREGWHPVAALPSALTASALLKRRR
jgi:hypothetical protein